MRYAAVVPHPQSTRGSRRETRLLLVTIAVAVAALLLLARFRFPEESARTAEPAPAPLERLAARAAYDELASTMADLERRLAPRLMVLRVSPARPSGDYAVAPRISGGRAVAVLGPDETLHTPAGPVDVVSRDMTRGVAILGTPSPDDGLVTPRTGAPRTGPRYIVVVDATVHGAALRPVYVGRTGLYEDPRTSTPYLTLEAVQSPIQRGAAVFSLEGVFLGLVTSAGTTTMVVAGDFLRAAADSAVRTAPQLPGDLGLEVHEPSGAVLRAAGAERGVIVSFVRPQGPTNGTVQPGDVIRSIDGTETPTLADYTQMEHSRIPGEPVTLVVVRRGAEQQVAFRAGAREPGRATLDEHGIIGRSTPGAGIEVVSVQTGSAGARAGLRRGDLILTIDGQAAADLAALTRSFRAVPSGGALLISLQRGQQHRVVALEKP